MIHWSLLSESFEPIRKNFAECSVSMTALACAIVLGCVEYFLWGRTHLDDGIPLIALLLLATFDQMKQPLPQKPTAYSRAAGWICLVAALAVMATTFTTTARGGFLPAFLRNSAILLILLGFSLRLNGVKPTLKFLPLFILAILILPFYEYLLLEISYPLRLVSTAVSTFILKLCTIHIDFDGTSMLWNGHVISITDACSGISLLGLLFFLEYLIVRSIKSQPWEKWCWSSLVILWIIIGNTLRLLVTFLLYRVAGECVFEHELHLALGCFFVVVTSLLIWFSSFIFRLDKSDTETE